MNGIRVSIVSTKNKGVILPYYDDQADILSLSSTVQRDWCHGIDIDGNVVFDLDSDFVIANVDVLVGKKLWTVNPSVRFVEPPVKGQVQILEQSIQHKSFHLPLNITSNKAKSEVVILFGKVMNDIQAIGLSNTCIAWIRANNLVGFTVKL